MTLTYEFEVTALCPNPPHIRNFYQVKIESDHMLWAETLTDAAQEVESHAGPKLLLAQEDITRYISERFPGTTVTLTGQHGRVRITSSELTATMSDNQQP